MRQICEQNYKLTDKERQKAKEINEYLKRNFTPTKVNRMKMMKLLDSMK